MTTAPPSRKKRLLWLAIPVLGAGILYGVLASSRASNQGPRAPAVSEATRPEKGEPSRMSEATKLSAKSGDTEAIVSAYAAWAKEPSAVPARKLLLATLLSEQDIARKLSSLLAAVEADPTPPEQDPLWEHVVQSLAKLWKGDAATGGMDLVVSEKRPRARRALISSFAALAGSPALLELNGAQRQTLTETMIDLAWHVPATQRHEVTEALRKLGGNDLADIYQGRGVTGADGHVLESEVAYKAALADTQAKVAEGSN